MISVINTISFLRLLCHECIKLIMLLCLRLLRIEISYLALLLSSKYFIIHTLRHTMQLKNIPSYLTTTLIVISSEHTFVCTLPNFLIILYMNTCYFTKSSCWILFNNLWYSFIIITKKTLLIFLAHKNHLISFH